MCDFMPLALLLPLRHVTWNDRRGWWRTTALACLAGGATASFLCIGSRSCLVVGRSLAAEHRLEADNQKLRQQVRQLLSQLEAAKNQLLGLSRHENRISECSAGSLLGA